MSSITTVLPGGLSRLAQLRYDKKKSKLPGSGDAHTFKPSTREAEAGLFYRVNSRTATATEKHYLKKPKRIGKRIKPKQ